MAIEMGNIPIPVKNDDWTVTSGAAGDSGTYRGFGSSWFNAENIAKEDWMRNEQSANLAFQRDLQQMQLSNAFNAEQAKLNRDWQSAEAEKSYERQIDMAKNQYQYAVEGMKAAGINPVLAFSQGADGSTGGHMPQASGGSSASSSSPSRSGSNYRPYHSSDPLNGIASAVLSFVGSVVGGKILQASKTAAQLAYLDKKIAGYKDNRAFTDAWKQEQQIARAYYRGRGNR